MRTDLTPIFALHRRRGPDIGQQRDPVERACGLRRQRFGRRWDRCIRRAGTGRFCRSWRVSRFRRRCLGRCGIWNRRRCFGGRGIWIQRRRWRRPGNFGWSLGGRRHQRIRQAQARRYRSRKGGGALFGSTASAGVPATTAGAFAGLEAGRATISTTTQLDPLRVLPDTVSSTDFAAEAPTPASGWAELLSRAPAFSADVGASRRSSPRASLSTAIERRNDRWPYRSTNCRLKLRRPPLPQRRQAAPRVGPEARRRRRSSTSRRELEILRERDLRLKAD